MSETQTLYPKCSTCPAVNDGTARWSSMTLINAATFERAIVWRCPACNYAKAADPRDARHKRAAKRGGFQSRAGKLGTTKAEA